MGGDYISDTAFGWFMILTVVGLLAAAVVANVRDRRRGERPDR